MAVFPLKPKDPAATPRQAEFTAWVEPHLVVLYRTACHYTGHPQDAEDLVQELLMRLYCRPRTWNRPEHPRSWLLRALHNLFVDRWRHEQHQPLDNPHEVPWEELLREEGSREQDPEILAESQVLRMRVLAALYALSRDQRAILVLHDMEGHTVGEISTLLGEPLGTVKSRLFRARRQLQARIFEAGTPTPAWSVLSHEATET